MKLRHGKLLTKERVQLIAAYLWRRDVNQWRRTNCGGIEYGDWVRGFEKFMCRGFEPLEGVSGVVRRGQVSHDIPPVPEPALEHAPQGHEEAP